MCSGNTSFFNFNEEVLWDHYDEAALPQNACYNTYLLELLLLGLQERIVLTQKAAVDDVFPWAVGDADIPALSSQVALHFSRCIAEPPAALC